MTRKSDFSRLYDTLGLKPGCSWEQVRKAYRRQAQSWHPDRFPETSPERAEAEKKIVRINHAYRILAAYWKQFGTLPGQNLEQQRDSKPKRRPPPRPATQPAPRATTAPPGSARPRPERQSAQRVSQHDYHALSLVALVFMCVFVFGLLYLDPKPRNSVSNPTASSLRRSAPGLTADPAAPPTLIKPARDDKSMPFFTIGSSMAKVNEIQGIPTRIEGNDWYYGASKIHFVDGLVASWQISASDPLYAMEIFDPSRDLAGSAQQGRIRKGSTKSEVRKIQGKPLFESEDVWEYRVSRIYFKNDRVIGWHNSPLDPLKVIGTRDP
jgi:hypothetical protein